MIRKVAIFLFSVHFTENQTLLEFVWSPGDRKICSVFWEIGDKAVIFTGREVCSLHYYGKFQTGDILGQETMTSFSLDLGQ